MRYSTKDLHFAAYLFVKGIALYAVQRRREFENTEKIRAFFMFENKELCEELERTYWNDETETVPIKKYIAAIRELRDRTGTMV